MWVSVAYSNPLNDVGRVVNATDSSVRVAAATNPAMKTVLFSDSKVTTMSDPSPNASKPLPRRIIDASELKISLDEEYRVGGIAATSYSNRQFIEQEHTMWKHHQNKLSGQCKPTPKTALFDTTVNDGAFTVTIAERVPPALNGERNLVQSR